MNQDPRPASRAPGRCRKDVADHARATAVRDSHGIRLCRVRPRHRMFRRRAGPSGSAVGRRRRDEIGGHGPHPPGSRLARPTGTSRGQIIESGPRRVRSMASDLVPASSAHRASGRPRTTSKHRWRGRTRHSRMPWESRTAVARAWSATSSGAWLGLGTLDIKILITERTSTNIRYVIGSFPASGDSAAGDGRLDAR